MSTISETAVSVRKPLYQSLFVQVLVALLLGIVLGMAVSDFAVEPKTLASAFLYLISRQTRAGRRRKGRWPRLGDRRGSDRSVPGDGVDRTFGPAGRAGSGWLYGRQIRCRLAQAADLAGCPVLCVAGGLRARRPRQRHGARRTEHLQVLRLSARGTDDCSRDRVVGRGASADHAQT